MDKITITIESAQGRTSSITIIHKGNAECELLVVGLEEDEAEELICNVLPATWDLAVSTGRRFEGGSH